MFMKPARMLPATLVLSVLGLALWASQPSARSTGVIGKTQSATGCSCHGSTPNTSVVVTITGPNAVAPGSTGTYTIALTGGIAGTTGGFNLKASSGTLVAGTGSQLLSGELAHVDNTRRSWTFRWTAPATAGFVNMYAVGLTSNGSGSSGDGWNFSGGALNTAFVIDVNPTPALPTTWGTVKDAYR
jgi:hypothetical protein